MKKDITRHLRVLILSVLLAANVPALLAQATAGDDYQTVLQRIVDREISLANVTRIDNDVTTNLPLLSAAGAFSNIDYTKTDQTNWPAAQHFLRLKYFALAYITPQSRYYRDNNIYTAIEKGINYWIGRKPISTNWWYNEIDTGQKLGLLLVLLKSSGNPLNETTFAGAVSYMAASCGDPESYNGANKIDLAIHWLYRGIASADDAVTGKATRELFEPSKLTTLDDGIQHDYSYAAHRHQLYIGGYGVVYVNATIDYADILNGTRWSIPADRMAVLHAFLTKTYLPAIRGKHMLYNVMGRSCTRVNTGRLEVTSLLNYLNTLKAIDPANTTDYDNAIKRIAGRETADYQLAPAHTHFWRTDYTLHQRPHYTIDTRLVSTRIARNEELNGENLKGYFLSDGGMAITVDGNEYSDLFPAWNWSKIPGTTTPAYPFAAIPSQKWPSYGRLQFAGGVSDGHYGASGYIYNDTYSGINTAARKGWFYFDDEVVCLGAGITSDNQYPIATTLNQCLLSNRAWISSNGVAGTIEGETHTDNTPDWVLHGKVGYVFPQGGRITVNQATKTGNWKNINTTNPDRMASKDIFSLWIDHGTRPQNATYAYIIVPGKSTAADMNSYNTDNITILANTSRVQAVRHNVLKVWQIVFFEAATFDHGEVSVTVEQPCIVMLKGVDTEEVTAYIADPTQTSGQIDAVVSTPLLKEKVVKVDLSTYASDKTKSGATQKVVITPDTESLTPEVSELSAPAIEDTYVQSGSAANTNYGTNERLVIKSNFTREAYLKFGLRALTAQIPAGKEVIKAQVVVYVRSGNTTTPSYPLCIKKTPSAWTELQMTWNNKATPEGEVLDQQFGKTTANAAISFDVTKAVTAAAWQNEEAISFHISQQGADPQGKHDIIFHSREYANTNYHPLLVLTLDDSVNTRMQETEKHYWDIHTTSVYPNPVPRGEFLCIKSISEQVEYSIINTSGKVVLRGSGNSINTAALTPDLYLIKVKDGSSMPVIKFMVK